MSFEHVQWKKVRQNIKKRDTYIFNSLTKGIYLQRYGVKSEVNGVVCPGYIWGGVLN